MRAFERVGGWGGRRVVWLIAIVVALVLALVLVVRLVDPGRHAARIPPGAAHNLLALHGDWTLSEMTVRGIRWDLGDIGPANLSLDRASLQGWTGCRAYATVYTVTALGGFTADPLGLSDETCKGRPAQVSRAYLDAFEAVVHWDIADDGALYLRGPSITLIYFRGSPSPSPT
jgi:hypothetical protein